MQFEEGERINLCKIIISDENKCIMRAVPREIFVVDAKFESHTGVLVKKSIEGPLKFEP